MKKLSLLVLAIATSFAASAQMSVIKEADRAMKNGGDYNSVNNAIKAAQTNPETAQNAQAWYIPGKAAFNQFDKLVGLRAFGKTGEKEHAQMGKLLISGFQDFKKAFNLDSVPDAKGKVKPKYTKDMSGVLAGHLYDYSGYGAELFNAQDFQGAYDAWDIFCVLPTYPSVAKLLTDKMPTDTIFGEIAYNQALAAWKADKLENALAAFEKAKGYGYNKKNLFDYAISVASSMNNMEAVLALSKEALAMYGDEDPMYMSQIVNYYLQAKDFDNAFQVINQAIAKEPNNAQYYVIQGVLFENVDKTNEAIEAYQKAIAINPENDQAVYNYGRQLCERAYKLSDEAPTRQDEYTKFFNEKLKPVFDEAAQVLEKAYNLNPDNTDVLKYLENVYYNLNDEKMLNDVKKRMAY